eukprot:1360285-Amphidinium_carterae.1
MEPVPKALPATPWASSSALDALLELARTANNGEARALADKIDQERKAHVSTEAPDSAARVSGSSTCNTQTKRHRSGADSHPGELPAYAAAGSKRKKTPSARGASNGMQETGHLTALNQVTEVEDLEPSYAGDPYRQRRAEEKDARQTGCMGQLARLNRQLPGDRGRSIQIDASTCCQGQVNRSVGHRCFVLTLVLRCLVLILVWSALTLRSNSLAAEHLSHRGRQETGPLDMQRESRRLEPCDRHTRPWACCCPAARNLPQPGISPLNSMATTQPLRLPGKLVQAEGDPVEAQPLQRMEQGTHWDLGRWAHHLLPFDQGLHMFNVYGYSSDNERAPEPNRELCIELLGIVAALGNRKTFILGDLELCPG